MPSAFIRSPKPRRVKHGTAHWPVRMWFSTPCGARKYDFGRASRVMSVGQAARWHSLIRPPRTGIRRTRCLEVGDGVWRGMRVAVGWELLPCLVGPVLVVVLAVLGENGVGVAWLRYGRLNRRRVSPRAVAPAATGKVTTCGGRPAPLTPRQHEGHVLRVRRAASQISAVRAGRSPPRR